MKTWSVQIHYDARDNDGKKFRATAVYWVEAETVGDVCKQAKEAFTGDNVVVGAIIPGKHTRFP